MNSLPVVIICILPCEIHFAYSIKPYKQQFYIHSLCIFKDTYMHILIDKEEAKKAALKSSNKFYLIWTGKQI